MSSLRLALKQSLEETSASSPPPPHPAVQGLPVVGRTSPHHAAAAVATTPGTGSGSVTSYHTEEDSTSPVPKKRGPGRPRKYPRPPGEQPRKRGRPRKHPPASGDEDAFSSENEFSVGDGHETEHSHEEVHHRVSAASKIQSHWKKSKEKPYFALEGSAVAEPPGTMMGETKTETQQSPGNDPANSAAPAPTTGQSKAVTPPSQELIEWMRSMSQKRARKAVTPGLRVKVRFGPNAMVKKDAKVMHELPPGRQAYLLCIEGGVKVNGQSLAKYDACEITGSGGPLEIEATETESTEHGDLAHILMFEMKSVPNSGRSDLSE